ncbi:hypothetical protein [Pseudarthrobacter sp. PS3-L1]|nr:hypothetical protein [Pseudarthrobacter sp. PS3-L1]MDJ0321605.1 hypothetical protein [Pseudarthrobacter sp. PS3-L1]
MESEDGRGVEGQTSISDLLDESLGTAPIQLSLPLHIHIAQGEYRRM